MENRRKTCRLCLRACENYQVIEASTTNMLDKLKLEINLPASGESLICTNCAETLINSFDFITMCVDMHQYIVSYLSNKENAKVDLKEVYLSKNENDLDIPKDHIVCGFCIGAVESCSAVSLDYELGKIMLERCLPELDLSIIENPIICVPCHESLDRCFHFVKDCLRIEEKIQEYREAERIDSKDLVELANVQEYTSRITLKSEECSNILETIKVETLCEDVQYANEEVQHDGRLLEVEDQKLNNAQEFTSNNTLVCKEEHDKYGEMVDIKGPISMGRDNEIKQENVDLEELENIKFLIKEDGSLMQVQDQHDIRAQQFPSELEDTKYLNEEDIEIKTDQDDFDSCQESFKEYKIEEDRLEPSVITSETTPKEHIKPNISTHKEVSEVTFTCKSCHITSQGQTFKCGTCPFETTVRKCLESHILAHKSASGINIFKCGMCSFETNRQMYLKSHKLITHKNFSEINMFKCVICSFETRYKANLKNHLITHKTPLEINMFKCEMCLFETRLKSSLKRHYLIHKSAAEIKMYKCETCPYETKHKNCMKAHMLVHKSPSEVNMFKCELCSFETKYRQGLKSHLLTHKNRSERSIFTCKKCLYQTRQKKYLKKHLKTHTSPSEVNMFRCKICSYKTICKLDLKKHELAHKSSSNARLIKCTICSYETSRKGTLKRHLVTHKRN